MRRGFLALTPVLVVLGACGASSARSTTASSTTATTVRAPAPVHCGPARAKTLAVDAKARVYASGGFVYGCTVLSPRITRLGRSNRCLAATLIKPVVVAGGLAAYGAESCGVDTGGGQVLVRRLADGVVLRRLDATAGPLRPESYQAILSIVAKSDGAVAWTARASSLAGGTASLQVLAADAHGTVRELDLGNGIVPASLRLHGSRLAWRDGGTTESASLS